MKALPFKIPKTEQQSIRVQVDEGPHFYDKLHYHPEWQLTAVEEGRGTLYIGSSFTSFQEGSVFLVGSNVAHLMRNEPIYFEANSPQVRAVSLFFHQHSLGQDFFELPELLSVKEVLNNSDRGILFKPDLSKVLHQHILACQQQQGLERFQLFVQILGLISQKENFSYLNAHPINASRREVDGQRLDEVFQFSFNHFSRKIELQEVAQVANLSVSQFCRYFKTHTSKTYIQFLNELRIEAACQLLLKKERSVFEIAYQCGFQNLSNFNRQFKKIKGIPPAAFVKAYQIR